MSEEKNLKSFTKDSVHLQLYPTIDNSSNFSQYKPNVNVINIIDIIRNICSGALSIRKKHNIRTRMPLGYIKIFGLDNSILDENLINILKEEINVKDIIFLQNKDIKIDNNIKLNFKNLGAKIGSRMNNIMNTIKQNDFQILDNENILCNGFELINNQDFVSIKTLSNQAFDSSSEDYNLVNNNIAIVVSIVTNENLESEGIARDFVRIIQTIRKDKNFNINHKINISHNSKDNVVLDAILKYNNYIKEQTLADSITFVENLEKINNSFFIDDTEINISIE